MEETTISPEEIRELLRKYQIGKKPLAMLLGWGESTVMRYLEGAAPAGEYSRRLRELWESPGAYYDLLMANQEKITKTAFHRSIGAFWQEQASSLVSVAAHSMLHCFEEPLSPKYLQYLLYYCQGFSLGIYGEPIFEEDCLVNDSHTFYKGNLEVRREMLLPLPVCEKRLGPQGMELAQAVASASRWYGAATFCQIHNLERKRIRIARNKDNEKIISSAALECFFKEVRERYAIQRPSDISNYLDGAYRAVRNW